MERHLSTERKPTIGRMLAMLAAPVFYAWIMTQGSTDDSLTILATLGFILGLISSFILVKRRKAMLTLDNVGWPCLTGSIVFPLFFIIGAGGNSADIGRALGTGLASGILCLVFIKVVLMIGNRAERAGIQ